MDQIIGLVEKIVVPLFFIGMAGSAVVIAISIVDDTKELLEKDEN